MPRIYRIPSQWLGNATRAVKNSIYFVSAKGIDKVENVLTDMHFVVIMLVALDLKSKLTWDNAMSSAALYLHYCHLFANRFRVT
jgi:hypothetical protein